MTGFDFLRKKNLLVLGRSEPEFAVSSLLPCLFTKGEGEEDYFSPKLCVHACVKDNNNSPHGKFPRFLFPFSSKISDLNFASYMYVLYALINGLPQDGGVGQPRGIRLCKAPVGRDFDIHDPQGGKFDSTAILKS